MTFFRIISLVSLFLFSATTFGADTLNSAINDCASIKRDLKRLACFDALSGKATEFPTEALTTNQLKQTQQLKQQAQPVSTSSPKDSFGLPSQQGSVDVITSYIPGKFIGWSKGVEIPLANGQVWLVIDSSTSLYHSATDAKVEIRRGVLNSYRIKVIGLNKSASVRRIK